MKKQNQHLAYMTRMALLIAIILLLEVSGLGMFKTFGLELTILQVPVIIGAIVLGPLGGTVLGTTFGLVSFWECLGKSAFGTELFSINPWFTFIVCVPTRMMMGFLCGVTFKYLDRWLKNTKANIVSYIAASLGGALLNTVFFMTALCICFYQTDYIQGFTQVLGTTNVFAFIVSFVGLQGLVEALLCATLGSTIAKPICVALNKRA